MVLSLRIRRCPSVLLKLCYLEPSLHTLHPILPRDESFLSPNRPCLLFRNISLKTFVVSVIQLCRIFGLSCLVDFGLDLGLTSSDPSYLSSQRERL